MGACVGEVGRKSKCTYVYVCIHVHARACVILPLCKRNLYLVFSSS